MSLMENDYTFPYDSLSRTYYINLTAQRLLNGLVLHAI